MRNATLSIADKRLQFSTSSFQIVPSLRNTFGPDYGKLTWYKHENHRDPQGNLMVFHIKIIRMSGYSCIMGAQNLR